MRLLLVLDTGPGVCIYDLSPPPDVAAFEYPRLFESDQDGGSVAVPQDPSHVSGWDFTGSSHTTIQIYGSVCSAVQAGRTTLRVMYVCLTV